MLNSASITPDGIAIVDFGDLSQVIPNASTTAGSSILFSELNSTVFQFEEVQAVYYQINGSCEAFWSWMESTCHLVTR